MNLKTSFFNKGIILNDFKRFSWIGIVYFLALFFTVPLQMLINYSEDLKKYNYNYEYNPMKNMLQFNHNEIMTLLIIVVPVIAAVFLFRYIHSKKTSDMNHSLPIKRETMYNSHIIVGLALLLVPLIVNGIICIVLKSAMGFEKYYVTKDVINWLQISIIINIIIFMTSIFVAMNTGDSIAQGVLTYILLFLPVGLSGLLFINLEKIIYGFSSSYYLREDLMVLSPITKILEYPDNTVLMTAKELGIYILICILAYIISKLLYKVRNVECASNVIVFSKLNPIFKYGVTFCTMLFGGAYFGSAQGSLKWIIFGYIIGSLIGYLMAQMILKKSIYVFKDIKGYLIYAAIMTLIFMGIKLDITGYQKHTPELSDIKSIYFNEYYNKDNYEETIDTYKGKENLINIKELHEKIINDKNINKAIERNERDVRSVVFIYELKNGKTISREYVVPYKNYHSYYKSIYESMEYKKNHYRIFKLNYLDIEKFEINPHNVSKGLVLTNSSEIRDAVEAVKKDLINETYEEMLNNKGYSSNINIILKKSKFIKDESKRYIEDIGFNKNDKELEKWLTEKGYIQNAKVMPEDVKYIVVEKRDNGNIYNIEENKSKKRLEINDKNQIEYCLNNYTNIIDESKYIIGFYMKNGERFEQTFDNNDIPDYINDYFKDK